MKYNKKYTSEYIPKLQIHQQLELNKHQVTILYYWFEFKNIFIPLG